MWLQQSGKDEEQCLREYILLVAQTDPIFDETVVKKVIDGTIKHFQSQSGGEQPDFYSTPLQEKDDSAYKASLAERYY